MNEISETTEIRLGTRGSKLALIQTEYIKQKIEANHPAVTTKIVIIKTTADKIQDRPLYRIGGKGLFLKEIEDALLQNRIDMAVHSMKDVPGDLAEEFEIGAITEREDPRDALISNAALSSLQDLPMGATVATCSFRRSSQLLHLRPDIRIVPIRGNQDTRLRKLKTENIDAIVLAMAGIRRMHFENIHLLPLDPDICLPSGGQGSIGVEIRSADANARELLKPLSDLQASTCIRAERACLRAMGAECYTPIAAFGEMRNSQIKLKAIIADLKGEKIIQGEIMGAPDDPEATGSELADQLFSKGAGDLIKILKEQTLALP
jgi:hydroxymethylbilane synthase